MEGYTKGKVVLATVFGDVHDIGKNLVNTILSNNGYTVYDLGKQVPLNTISTRPTRSTRTPSASRRCWSSTSKQMPLCVQELHRRQHGDSRSSSAARPSTAPMGSASSSSARTGAEQPYGPGVFYARDAFEGLEIMDQLTDADAARGACREGQARGG